MKKILAVCCLFFLSFEVKAAEEDSLRLLYEQVSQNYVEPITVEKLALLVLKSFRQVDKSLTVADDNNKVSLYYKGRLIKSLYKPQDMNNVEAWTKLSGEIFDLVLAKSKEAQNRDFEILDLVMQKAVEGLDKDSKYYLSLEDAKSLKHRVHFVARREGDILLIKIGAFNNFTKEEIVKAINENQDAKGMILDLRASPGGQLSTAIEVADLFLDEGIVISAKGRKTDEITYYNSEDGDIWENKPIVVMVDGDSASAAEVLTIALQEQSRAKVVGTKTFGKGTIQNLLVLKNGGTLAYSSAYFHTPSGKKLADNAIVPDVCTYQMPEGKDVLRLINAPKDEECGQENRQDGTLEYEIAVELLKI